ncbi:Prostaglandin reductase 1 [Operophtera brumata]|uniref:15-oxoprostaglandin 13-reductase n=1 Tax=Operophtera brumata TaxID=104452 RepID=A0A0L7KYE8_OPEBR|nr:Prostaglandin reductase 1 [Operophtera brumata]
MVIAKKYVVNSAFEGVPKKSDFSIVEEELPALNDNAEAAYLSVDPYQRMKLGDKFPCDMIGGQIAKNTSYFGFTELCRPQPGETVVVSGAAGAVGSHVGQIAKILGCKVIGLAGTDQKCKWLVKELGFNAAGNYKTVDLAQFLKEKAPKGIDCYYDNVGGEISSTVISQMNLFGRVAPYVVGKQLKIEGFLVNRFDDRTQEGILKNLQWVREGKLKYREHITHGFERADEAFIGLFTGDNTGKTLVKII